jgi:hypothetical protein
MRDIKEKIQRTIKKINKNNENSNNHLTTNEIKDISSLLSSKMFHESRDKTTNLSDYLNKISDENDIKPIIKQLKTEDMINNIGSHKFIVNNTSKPEYYISPESFEEFLELTDLDPTNKVKINNNIEKEELARLIFFLIIMNKKLSFQFLAVWMTKSTCCTVKTPRSKPWLKRYLGSGLWKKRRRIGRLGRLEML